MEFRLTCQGPLPAAGSIKVLFDGLRLPETTSELGGFPIEADEDPFFCPRVYFYQTGIH
jgi:hypothetical protein